MTTAMTSLFKHLPSGFLAGVVYVLLIAFAIAAYHLQA